MNADKPPVNAPLGDECQRADTSDCKRPATCFAPRMETIGALEQAVNRDNLPALKAALKAGASPDGLPGVRWLPLTIAVLFNRVAIVRELLRAGADLARFQRNWRRQGGSLSDAELPTLRLLGSAGIDVRTPLLLRAVEDGDVATAKSAIAAGADVHARGSRGDRALEMALGGGHLALASALLAAGAKLSPKREDRAMVLNDAIANGDLAVVKAAISIGIDPRIRGDLGENALMWAAEAGKLDMLDYFLAQGVDPKAVADGKSLLDCARAGGNRKVIARVEAIGVGSTQEGAEFLARALKKEFGGRLRIEVTAGEFPTRFLLASVLPGLGRTHFGIGAEGWQLNCEQFGLAMPGLDPELPAWFIVNRTKPVGFLRDGKPVLVPGVFTGLPVARGERTPVAVVKRFSRAHARAIRALRLRPGEFIFFGWGRMALRCLGGDMAQARARIEILRGLHASSPAPEPVPERTLFTRECRFQPAPRGAAHRLGGAHAAPPACPGCGGAAQLVAELDLRDTSLPKTKLRRKTWPVFWCLECGDWGPTFHDVSAERLVALDDKKRPVAAPAGTSTTDLRERPMALLASADGKKPSRGSKVGGTPVWVQSPAIPECPCCQGPMTFVLQLASDRTISYDDLGTLYSFACPDCRMSATLVQSH